MFRTTKTLVFSNNKYIILRGIENVNVAQSKVHHLFLNYTTIIYKYELKLQSL